MRIAPGGWLLRGAGALAFGLAACWAPPAHAQLQRDLRMCATQTESLADQRLAACSRALNSGRLRGKPLGVVYALRGLAYLDRSDIPHAIGDLDRAIDLAPDFAAAYQNRGNAWYARGNYGEALSDYDAAIRLDPGSPSPYVNRATVRRDLGYAEGALKDYQKAIDLGSDGANVYRGRGQLYLRSGDYAKAIADFDRALRLEPDAATYMLRAEAHAGAGDDNGALKDYEEVLRRDGQNVAAMTAVAGIWRKRGDIDKAIALYDRAIDADQKRAASYKLRAEAYAAKGRRQQAIADVGRALKFSWTSDLLKLRAALRLEDGDLDGVLHDANAMLKLNAQNAGAYALRGIAFARKNDYAHALPDLDKAIEDDDKNGPAYSERARIYLSRHDGVRALADLSRAIALGAGSPADYVLRARIYKENGKIGEAIADLDTAIKRDPRPPAPYVERALLRKAEGKTDLALADLDAALARAPGDTAALGARAELRQGKGDAAGALADYQAIIARQPKNTSALQAHATLLMQSKSYAKAAEEFDRLAALEPRNARIYFQRGQAREAASQRDKALSDYELALSHEPAFADARKAVERLRGQERQIEAIRLPDEKPRELQQAAIARLPEAAARQPAQPKTAPVESAHEPTTGSIDRQEQEHVVPAPPRRVAGPVAKPRPREFHPLTARELRRLTPRERKRYDRELAQFEREHAKEVRHTAAKRVRPEHEARPQREARQQQKHVQRRQAERRRERETADAARVERRRVYAPTGPVYYRAGSIHPGRDLRFTDIWR